jgi:hypothetical protein
MLLLRRGKSNRRCLRAWRYRPSANQPFNRQRDTWSNTGQRLETATAAAFQQRGQWFVLFLDHLGRAAVSADTEQVAAFDFQVAGVVTESFGDRTVVHGGYLRHNGLVLRQPSTDGLESRL